ncbi:MAG: hypothetical protein J6B95_03435 [Oscillospiraceae bacterium]|nr:hypothetical protein [Oscillospiraceae bacterium]
MEQMEEKLGALLGNPDMMQKIMSMAQALGASQEMPQPNPAPPRQERSAPELDMASIQKIMSFARQTSLDRDQQNLLNALKPYLPRERIAKLEKAMRAARLANLATSVQL